MMSMPPARPRCKRPTICMMLLAVALLPTCALLYAGEKAASASREKKGVVETMIHAPLATYSLKGSLTKAVATLETLSKVRIRVDWDALLAAGVKPTTRVQLAGQREPFIEVVELLLAQVATKGNRLVWYLDGDILHITTKQNRPLPGRTPVSFTVTVPTRKAPASKSPTKPAGKKPARRKITLPREIRFQETPLEEVVGFFRTKVGLNIVVNWNALKQQGIERQTPVTFQAKRISLATALDMTLRCINTASEPLSKIYWLLDDGIIRIASGEALNGNLKTRVLDVRDLLMVLPDFKGPSTRIGKLDSTSLKGSSSGGDDSIFGDDEEATEDPKSKREVMEALLIDTVKKSIGEDWWFPQGRGTAKIFNGRLIINQTELGFLLMERAGRSK